MAFSKIIAESMDLTDTYAFTGTVTGAGEANSPAFVAYANANQSISDRTTTKVAFNAEHLDTDGAYDTSNYKFVVPSGGAGKYFLSAGFNSNGSTTTKVYIYILVNNTATVSSMRFENIKYGDNDSFIQMNRIVTLAVADYVEVYVRQEQGSTSSLQSDGSWFQGFKISS